MNYEIDTVMTLVAAIVLVRMRRRRTWVARVFVRIRSHIDTDIDNIDIAADTDIADTADAVVVVVVRC